MEKRIISVRFMAVMAVMFVSLSCYSQEKKAEPFIELQPTIGLGTGSSGSLQLLGGSTWKMNESFSLGFGAGVNSSFKFNAIPSIPAFVRTKVDFSQGNVVPFAMLDLGYNFIIDDFDLSSVLVSPTVGVRMGSYSLGVGYIASIPTKSGLSVGHNLAFKLGYLFRGGGTMPAFIRKSYVQVEAGYAFGTKEKEFFRENYDGADDYKVRKLGTEAFARLIWMFRVTDNVEVGIGSGIDIYFQKLEKYYYDDGETVELLSALPIYFRPRYKFFDKSAKMRPYIACDLGYRIDLEHESFGGIMIEPQVGVELGKLNFAAALHTPTYKDTDRYGNSENCGASAISVRAGYRF